MTGPIIKLPDADPCALSPLEAEVLWRVSEGRTINSISSELGLAEPIVKEYIRSILGKVRTREVERPTRSDDAGLIPKQDLFKELLSGTATAPQP
jgi:DNA-binding NarL/FixJ family response regulator